uniref:Uncharacterized protein n=1 Tax=Arundo donax TaxID=35708 RepID=A0A0A9EL67_ARUDO
MPEFVSNTRAMCCCHASLGRSGHKKNHTQRFLDIAVRIRLPADGV